MAEGSSEKDAVYSAGSDDEDETFEQATGPKGESGFAVYVEVDDEIKFTETYESKDATKKTKEYFPLDKTLWPLAKFPQKEYWFKAIAETETVFEMVREYVYENVELPHEALYDVVTLWNMATWVREKFETAPLLNFVGPKDSGKTRAMEVCQELSYRGLLSPSFSNAAIFRTIEEWHPTLFLDEAEIYNSEHRSEAIAVLNAGYRRGQYVIRINEDTRKPEGFDCFGFKGTASIDFFVPTLESRGIPIHMRRNVRSMPIFKDHEKAASLRLLLLTWRFRIMRGQEQILEDREKILGYLPIRNGRIVELFYPLVAVAPNEEVRQKVGEYANDVYGKRLEEEKTSVEAEVVQVLLDLKDKVESGKLCVQAVTDKFNEGKPEKQQWNPRSIGRSLKKLGFTPTRLGTKGSRAVYYEQVLLDYLEKRYTSEKTSETSETSASPLMEHSKATDITDITDVSLEVSPIRLSDLTSVYWKDEPLEKRKCGVCGYSKPTVWEAVTVKGQVIAICQDCAQAYQKEREGTNG